MKVPDEFQANPQFRSWLEHFIEDKVDEVLKNDDAIAEAHGSGPLDQLQQRNFGRCLAKAIEGLPDREQLVLSLYYDDELNLKEIGHVLGVSESRVSQIHSQAALRLRARLSDWWEA